MPKTKEVIDVKTRKLTFKLTPLPYAADALAPHMSTETLLVHYGKHHRKYVDKLNSLIDGTKYAEMTLPEIIRVAHGNADDRAVFNNAAQTWNHDFFWQSMTADDGGGAPADTMLSRQMAEAFGELDGFKEAFVEAATGQFGSGWVWLVAQPDGSLSIEKTGNAENPLIGDTTPLLTCDVWEHAYYLDHRNRRADFVARFLDHLVNWNFVADNLAAISTDNDRGLRSAVG